jgi:hypothetical protein
MTTNCFDCNKELEQNAFQLGKRKQVLCEECIYNIQLQIDNYRAQQAEKRKNEIANKIKIKTEARDNFVKYKHESVSNKRTIYFKIQNDYGKFLRYKLSISLSSSEEWLLGLDSLISGIHPQSDHISIEYIIASYFVSIYISVFEEFDAMDDDDEDFETCNVDGNFYIDATDECELTEEAEFLSYYFQHLKEKCLKKEVSETEMHINDLINNIYFYD